MTKGFTETIAHVAVLRVAVVRVAVVRVVILVGGWLATPAVVAGQDPPPPDSLALAPDSVAPDSMALTDSTLLDAQVLLARDSAAAADSVLAPHNLPDFTLAPSEGWKNGYLEWNHDEIMASAAASLGELLAEVPGVVAMLGGDYGAPVGLTSFGLGGGGVRIFRDGFELYPFAGGVPDLARIGLGGIERVRLARDLTTTRIDLYSTRNQHGRAFSLIEVGTGELDTNVFRGTLAAPRALGGSIAVALERTDTRGTGGNEPGNFSGSWLRYQWHRGDALGVALDYRNMRSETELTPLPSAVARSDWVVRARAQSSSGFTGEAYFGGSSHRLPEASDTAGAGPGVYLEGGSRSQLGARVAFARFGARTSAEFRRFGGGGFSEWRLDGSAGWARPGVGGVEGRIEQSAWDEARPRALSARAWTSPLAGILSLFASIEQGSHGARRGVVRETLSAGEVEDASELPGEMALPEPWFGVGERTGRRAGARIEWRGVSLSGALLEISADTVFPLALANESEAVPLSSVSTREGAEYRVGLPVPGVTGLNLQGFYRAWDTYAPYLPETSYDGALVYHRSFLETGNFEWWWKVGVRGHSEMVVPTLTEGDGTSRLPTRLPAFQYWYARTQARVLSVRVFVRWDNLLGNPDLQFFPDRTLPPWRTVFGIRWTMLN